MASNSLYAYVDETGDRGSFLTTGSSPIFGMAALLVTDQSAAALRSAVTQLITEFSVPASKVMSWKSHVKTHSRRLRAAQVLAAVSDLRIIYVYCVKSQIAGDYTSYRDRFYNYVVLKLYRNILWAARNWKGPGVGLHTRFGHVRGHDHTETQRYFGRQLDGEPNVPARIERGLRWVSADKYLESQAADVYGGFLKAATWPDEYGNIEARYLKTVWHQIRRNPQNCPVPLGLMSMPDSDLVKQLAWCECSHC